MAEENAKCSVCEADLEGSDIYEGLCHKCREDQVLGRPPSARKPPRRATPPPLRPATPPPLKPSPEPAVIAIETDVDTDADTREMLALQEAAPAPPAAAAPPAPGAGEAASISFVELQRPADRAIRTEEGAGPAGPAPPPVEAGPPKNEEPRLSPEPPVLRLRPQSAATEFETEPERAPAAPPPLGVPHTVGRPAPPPAARPAHKAEEPVVLSLQDQPKPRLAAEAPLRLQEQAGSVELRALLGRLSHDIEEVSARLRGSAGLSMTPRQQVGFGFRAFFGFLLGAALFALAGIGILGLAGLLFHPPALAFLRRLLYSIIGTP